MPKYLIEREIPNAGQLTQAELRVIALRKLKALGDLGPKIQWQHSYVTDNKVYCVYIAPDEEIIRKHAKMSDVPANRISAVRRVLDASSVE